MPTAPGLTTFRIGDPPADDATLRVGVVRRPPRGVARARWRRDGYFDLWFPVIAPSLALLARFPPRTLDDPAVFTRFAAAYRRELARPDARHTVELLAAIAARMPLAIGCYCDDERQCHRSVLLDALRRSAPGS